MEPKSLTSKKLGQQRTWLGQFDQIPKNQLKTDFWEFGQKPKPAYFIPFRGFRGFWLEAKLPLKKPQKLKKKVSTARR